MDSLSVSTRENGYKEVLSPPNLKDLCTT